MSDQDDAPGTVTLRVMRVVHLMALGRWFTTHEAAQMTGMTESGARKLLERMVASEHVPVLCVQGDNGVLIYGMGRVFGYTGAGHTGAGQADRASDAAV
jgi:hypothetical protein